MVIDILCHNIDAIRIPVKKVKLPDSKESVIKSPLDITPMSFSFDFESTKPTQRSIKEWGAYIHNKQQESIDEEGCGAVMCEYNIVLWEIFDAYTESN